MGKIITNTLCHCTKLRRSAENVTAFYNRRLAPAGITVRQFALLRQISLHPGCSVSGLADITQLDRSTLARNLKHLFKTGYLEDRKEAKARNSQLHLTETGTTVYEQALPIWQATQKIYEDIVGAEADRDQISRHQKSDRLTVYPTEDTSKRSDFFVSVILTSLCYPSDTRSSAIPFFLNSYDAGRGRPLPPG